MELQRNKPLVSIGMPAYNGEQYLRKALDSLLAQDYENFELLISDNASTDATFQICQEYAERDKHIRVYRNEHNLGALKNFQVVLEKARGKYFMWAAVDDCWLPGFVTTLVKELEKHPEAGVAMCAVDRIDNDGVLFDTIRFKDRDNPNGRTYYQMMKSLTSFKKYNLYIYGLFRTPLLKEAFPSFQEVPRLDRLFMCQMALATRFRYVDQVLHIRMHQKQSLNERYPDEKFNKMQNEDKWVDVKVLYAFGLMLYRSSIIPRYRKIYIPMALWRYSWLLLQIRFFAQFNSSCLPRVWNRLKYVKRWMKYF